MIVVERHEVLVVGAGNAGVSLAAKLLKDGARDVAVVDRRQVHRYRPLLNYVGSGEATMADLERAQHEVLPSGATWVRDDVASVVSAPNRYGLYPFVDVGRSAWGIVVVDDHTNPRADAVSSSAVIAQLTAAALRNSPD